MYQKCKSKAVCEIIIQSLVPRNDTRGIERSAFAKVFAKDSKATMSGVTLDAKTEMHA